jgi:hypothetical protein
MSGAPPVAADTSNCQQVGSTTTCGQGRVSGTAGDNAGIQGHNGVMAPFGEGCINPYETYQNCAVQEQGLFGIFRSAR